MNHQQTADDSLLNMIHLDLKKKRILCTPKNYHCSAHHCPCSALTHLRLFCLSTILSSDGSGTQTWSLKLFGQYSTRTITSSYYPSCFKLFMNTFFALLFPYFQAILFKQALLTTTKVLFLVLCSPRNLKIPLIELRMLSNPFLTDHVPLPLVI